MFLEKTHLVDNQHLSSSNDAQLQNFVPNQAREKWIKKRTSVKTRNGAANHRGNDVIVQEGRDQVWILLNNSSQVNQIFYR